jgi:hypothetical protein
MKFDRYARGVAAVAGLLLSSVFAPTVAQSPSGLSADQIQSIATDAYIYFYPLVTMDVTRRQMTNVDKSDGLRGPMNAFTNVPTFPTAEMREVVRPNFDTLYSSGFLDLTKGPVVISVPDTGGRYYMLPMLDMWTDVFASPGSRTTGTKEAHFLVTPPGWRPDLRERFVEELRLPKDTQRIDAPTPYVWVIGRTKTDGPPDYPAVHKIQQGYKITPLTQWGKTPKPVAGKIDPGVDMKTPPKTQVDTMPADKYFTTAAELLKLHPPHITDQPIIAQLRRVGIEAGKSLDFAKLDPAVRAALERSPAEAQKLMEWKVPTLARVTNGWSMNTDTMGVYGNYYVKRAIIAQQGLGANLPEDAVYPLEITDAAGKPLDGANKYTLRFEKDAMPPVSAFWSVTLYDRQGFQVANPLNRFAVSSWMPFKQNPDGSLVLFIQNESPGKDNEQNWLPAPKGSFNLTMRLYGPKSDILTGRWNPPPVQPAGEGRAIGEQK